jgi:dTDP-glucose 4,6-dehydratase
MSNFKRILVTGGYGFIGSALIRKLLKDTDAEIFNIDKFSIVSNDQSIKSLLDNNQNYNERYNYYNIDLFDFSLLKSTLFEVKPDLVFHLAAESHVDRSIEDPKQFLNSNIIGTYNLIEITREYLKSYFPKNFRLLHISTDEVFGSLGEFGKFNELTPYNPRSPYSATKACSDHLVRAWRHTYNLPFIVTNCSNNFGEWQFPEKLIPLTIQKFLNNEKVPIYGNGLQIRDWLYVEDHVNALLLISKNGKITEDYCIGGNSEMSNLEVIKKISIIINKFSEYQHNIEELISFVKDRPGHDTRYAIDYKKINLELGWEPNYKFNKALEITTKWYLNNQNWSNKVLSRANYDTQRLGLIK